MMKKKTAAPKIEELSTDVLVIGAGGAGLRAAIEAKNNKAKVLIITKEYMGGAHTSMAMGGMNVAIKAPATPKQHYQDTISGGWQINNHKMAKVFAKEMPARIYDLERYGVKFDRLPDGSFYTWAGGKHSAPLNICAGDYTGREMMNGLVAEIKRLKIPYLEDHFVTKIFTNKKRVVGALVMDLKTGKLTLIKAKATIIATGGAGMLYLVNTNAPSNTGEGYGWGLNAGAELVDMEMIQFHPTGMAYPPAKRGRLITEKVRGHGGKLLNKDGERFMMRYQPKRLELAGRDEVTRAIYQEIQEGRGTRHGGVYLDITWWDKGQAEKLIPDVFAEHMEVGIDIRRQKMEISPTMHHVMGGININEWGETNVPGLYAVGEVTRTIHGANRLGGNSLSEGQVFGRRVGLKTAKTVTKGPTPVLPKAEVEAALKEIETMENRKSGVKPEAILKPLKQLMWDNVGIIRTEKKLKMAQAGLLKLEKQLKHLVVTNKLELQQALELLEMIPTAQMIVMAAILRKESRGAHYREDYPKTSKKWEKNIAIYKTKSGTLKTKLIPVVK